MSKSKFKLTRENTNLARVAQMILGPCTNVLRDVLRKKISPVDLEKKVKAYVTNTKKPLINQQQESLIYGHDYSKFDVTLLYFLLRNMCSIQPHSNKWGNNPSPGDKSVSANIERIRLIRNEYGHNSETSISDTDFNNKYQSIKDIVQELEKYIGSSTKYQDEVKELETCPMDPTQSEKNIKELLDLHETIKDIAGDVKEMRNTVVPWNIKVIYGKDVLKWREDDNFFVETHNFQAVLDKVRQQPFVMFVGVPGSGKSATARHIALLLQEKDGYEILPTKDIKDIETYCDPRSPQVFVIDDVLGVFGFDMKELEKLTMYKDRLNEPTMPGSKVLMTCREVVFKHEAFSGSFLSNDKHVVQLHSKENALNDQDKYHLFAKYNLDKDLLSANTLSNISKSFPYLCKLFSRKEELKDYGPQFFISPVPCIIQLLDDMKRRNKIHYASLALLMTNQNTLSEEDFNNENTKYFVEMKFRVLKRCKVDPKTCSFYFIDAMTAMVGTYTEQLQSKFKFIHDSMLEIVAYHFGRHSPELILQYMDSDYIANYIKPDDYKCRKRKREGEEDKLEQTVNVMENSDTVANEEIVYDLCIRLPESYYHLLVDRLFEDIRKGEWFNVFENDTLKHPAVLQTFLDVMKGKPYLELFTVFLSDSEAFSQNPEKLSKNYVFTSKNVDELYLYSCSYPREDRYLLTNIRRVDIDSSHWGHYMCVRAIDWVIFYGHNRILQYIIDQIIKHTKTVNDLFLTPFNDVNKDWHDNFPSKKIHYFKKRRKSNINKSSACKCDVSDDESCFESCFESYSELCSESDSSDEYDDDACSDEDDYESCCESDDGVGMVAEPLIIEQRRLLNLCCCNGDIPTFQTLLAYVDKDVLTSTSIEFHIDECYATVYAQPLIVASECGHLNILLKLLEHGVDVNVNFCGTSPLNNSILKGHLDIVLELLNHGAYVNNEDSHETPLTAACKKGHLDIVLELLKHGAYVNIEDSHETPLTAACKKGHLDIVLELLNHGAYVNIEDSHESPLTVACSKGHLDIVLELLKHGAYVNIKDSHESPLTAACKKGHLDIVLELLKHGAHVNMTVSDYAPLISACSGRHSDTVLELIKHGADVNIKTSKWSPVLLASFWGNLGIVHVLLKHGADVNSIVSDISPLIAACLKGHLDIVLELIKHGAHVNFTVSYKPLFIVHDANVNIKSSWKSPLSAGLSLDAELRFIKHEDDIKFGSPLIAACKIGRLDIVLELIKHGADINLTVSYKSPLIVRGAGVNNKSSLRSSLTAGLNLDAKVCFIRHREDIKFESPLIAACKIGRLDIVLELIKHGADINITVFYSSPLIVACVDGRLDIVLELLKHGADVNISVSDNSPLIAACSKRNLDIVLELIKHGADVNITVSDNSPLITACSKRNLEIVLELIKHGADVNITVSDNSPLIAACKYAHLDLVLDLLKHGADVNMKVPNSSPLITACKYAHLDLVLDLLKHGADVNMKVNNSSPLITACKYAHLDLVLELLKHGADVNMKVFDSSPLIVACVDGRSDVVLELLKHGADVNITVSDKTPFIVARPNRHLDIVHAFLKHGADINILVSDKTPKSVACPKRRLSIVRAVLEYGARFFYNGEVLIDACSKGHLDIVLQLLKHGVDVNITYSDNSPLIGACLFGSSKIVRQLLKHGADVNITTNNKSPLIAACSKGYLDIISLLLEHGADVNIQVSDISPLVASCEINYRVMKSNLSNKIAYANTISNDTLYRLSCSKVHLAIIRKLLQHGADVNGKHCTDSPLNASCSKGHLNIVCELLKHGADVNFIVNYSSPLITACEKGHLDIVGQLIKHGANVNMSPLIAACSEGRLDIVLKLLKHGADVQIRVSDNSPLLAARSRKHFDLVSELIKRGANY